MAATGFVAALKDIVNEKLQLKCPADKLQLYKVEDLVQSADNCSLRLLLGGQEYSDDTLESQNLVDQVKLIAPVHPVSTYLLNTSAAPGSIHVLVEQPRVKRGEENLDGSEAAAAEHSHVKRERECIPFAEMAVERRKQLTSELRLVVCIRTIRKRLVSTG